MISSKMSESELTEVASSWNSLSISMNRTCLWECGWWSMMRDLTAGNSEASEESVEDSVTVSDLNSDIDSDQGGEKGRSVATTLAAECE